MAADDTEQTERICAGCGRKIGTNALCFKCRKGCCVWCRKCAGANIEVISEAALRVIEKRIERHGHVLHPDGF